MKKFFAMFCIPIAKIKEWESESKSDQQKAEEEQMMKEWETWTTRNKASLVEEGQPLGDTKRVTKGNVADVRNDMAYYCIVQAESHDAAAKLLADNPHLQIPEAYIEVMEIVEME